MHDGKLTFCGAVNFFFFAIRIHEVGGMRSIYIAALIYLGVNI